MLHINLRSWPLAGAAVLGLLVGAALFGVILPRAAVAQEPTFIIVGGNDVTAIAYYADGTSGDASQALSAPWRPGKPVRMLAVASQGACSITVDEKLAVTEGAAVNRLAVCMWVAPG